MTDREKVIKGLECAIGVRGHRDCDNCPYDNDFNCLGCDIVMRDALALLKEQAPRVLTLGEVMAFVAMALDDTKEHDPKWVEFINYEPCQRHWRTPQNLHSFMVWGEAEKYGKTWRCWDKRPTDEQRRAVKWDD